MKEKTRTMKNQYEFGRMLKINNAAGRFKKKRQLNH